jgi:hypothetical protein
MKKFKNKLTAGLFTGLAVAFTLSSCQKKFDPKSYAPSKPLPSFNGYSSSKQIESENLVAFWPFSGNLKDSLSSTTGVATGTSFAAGVEGQGLQGASNGYVISNVPDAVKALHSFTITTWYNMAENTSGVVALIDIVNSQNFWGDFDLFLENPPNATTANLKVHVWNNAGSTTGTDAWEGDYLIDNAFNVWNQVTVTYDDATSTVTVYYNGASVGTNTQAGFAPLNWAASTQMVFGTLQFQTNPSLTSATTSQGWANYLTGKMDQVRIYDVVLSSSEISALYNLEKLGR